MNRLLSLLIMVFVLFAHCTNNNIKIDHSAEIQKIRAADRDMLRAETERDLETAMTCFATNAVFQPPNAPPVIGQDAISEFFSKQFEIPYSGIYCESDTIVVSKSGDMAYLLGNSYYAFDTPGGSHKLDGKYITIWQKIEGKWLCVAVSWSGNKPVN